MAVHVVTYDTAHPGDTVELQAQLQRFPASAIKALALIVKTEGNADSNDYSREYGLLAAEAVIEAHGGAALLDRSTFLFSTGCEGVMTPFGYLFLDVEDPDAAPAAAGAALVFAGARSRQIRPDEVGMPAHADLVAETVAAAMRRLAVAPADVGLVIVKNPLVSLVPAAGRRGAASRVTSAHSKALGALGAGLALGEVVRADLEGSAVAENRDLHARRAMVFSSSEGGDVEVLVFANRRGASGDLLIHTGSFTDLLDAAGIRRTLAAAGCDFDADGVVQQPERVAAAFIKAGIAADGRLRDFRTTMRTSHIDMDKHVRATMSGLAGAIFGSCRMFISANTVHQAPDGGGLCAFIVKAP